MRAGAATSTRRRGARSPRTPPGASGSASRRRAPGSTPTTPRGSDFGTVVALYEHDTGNFAGCSSTGSFSGSQGAERTYDVYVGRRPTETGFGTNARLVVNGPAQAPPTLTLTSPAPASTVNTRRPTFSGTASTRAGDSATVTVKVWQGNDVAAPPLMTLPTQRTGSTWQVAATSDLPNGFYVWRAEQEGATGTGASGYDSFGVQVTDPTPPAGGGGTTTTTTAAGNWDGRRGHRRGSAHRRPPTRSTPTARSSPARSAARRPSRPECTRARTARTLAARKVTTAKKALKKAKGARKKRAARKRVTKAKAGLRTATSRQRRFCA